MGLLHDKELKGASSQEAPEKKVAEQKVPIFGDPEEYENMDDAERESLTESMMGKHKTWTNEK